MSTTESQARTAVRAQLPDSAFSFPIYWQGDDAPTLPDTPSAFAFVVFSNEGSGRRPTAYGGGRGNNLFRSSALVEAFVFSPTGSETGAEPASDRAELIAARLRGYRDANISCKSADVIFIGPGSAVSIPGIEAPNNYRCAVAEIALTFDLIG